MDSYRHRFFWVKNEKGIALTTTMLMIILVVALITMALNISRVEVNLSSTNRRTTQGFHAAGGGAEVAIPIVEDIIQQNAIPGTYPATVVIDPATGGGDATMNDFLEEIVSGGGVLAADQVSVNPDITTTALVNHTVRIDVDYEGPVKLPGSELEEFAARYHKKVGGVGCSEGTLYYIDSLANGPMQTRSNVGSAYYDCY